MAVNDVCRLCLATDDLVWIFNDENSKLKMKDVISITTGIEIHMKDVISQKVCEKCYQFSIKAFQFRSQCLKADKYLKAVCRDYLVDKKLYIPNTEVTIKSIVKAEEGPKPKPIFKSRPYVYNVHPSVIKLSKTYPEMKLPRICLSFDIAPVVEMELEHVENYFKRVNLNFTDCVKGALKAAKNIFPARPINKSQKSSTQKLLMHELKEVKMAKTSKTSKSAVSSDETISFNREKNKIEEHCKSLSNTPVIESNLQPDGMTLKKLVDSPPEREMVDTHNTFVTNLTKVQSENDKKIKKRKHIAVEKSPSCDLSNKRRKIFTENVSNEKISALDLRLPSTRARSIRKPKLLQDEKFSKEKIDKDGLLDLNQPDFKSGLSNDKESVENSTSILNKNTEGESTLLKSTTNNNTDSEICSHNVLINCNENQVSENHTKETIDEIQPLTEVTSIGNELNGSYDHDSLTSVGKSVPLFVCDICNSVQYNMYELKKHQNKHMRCQFCKVRFRSIETKRHHIENVCIIKKMMNNLPHLELVKVELNRAIRQKYPRAFTSFFPLPHIDKNSGMMPTHQNSIYFKEALFKDFPPERLDIIEILSDDDTLPTSISEIEQPPIEPDVSIKNKTLFAEVDLKATEHDILKDVLTKLQKSSKESETQTAVLTSSDITVRENNNAVLKNLIPLLSQYTIRVDLQSGDFGVSYDYIKSNSTKEFCFWNDLTPTDINSKAEGTCTSIILNGPLGSVVQDAGTESSISSNIGL